MRFRAFLPLSLGLALMGSSYSCSLEPLPVGGGGAGGDTGYKLTANVDVRRDELGMVHVYGKTDADVWYAAGYMQAVDRLFQMELQKRHAQGRQAEVFGDSMI